MSIGLKLIRDALSKPLCELSISATLADESGATWDELEANNRPSRGLGFSIHRFRCGAQALYRKRRMNGKPVRGLGRVVCPVCCPDVDVPRGMVLVRYTTSGRI